MTLDRNGNGHSTDGGGANGDGSFTYPGDGGKPLGSIRVRHRGVLEFTLQNGLEGSVTLFHSCSVACQLSNIADGIEDWELFNKLGASKVRYLEESPEPIRGPQLTMWWRLGSAAKHFTCCGFDNAASFERDVTCGGSAVAGKGAASGSTPCDGTTTWCTKQIVRRSWRQHAGRDSPLKRQVKRLCEKSAVCCV